MSVFCTEYIIKMAASAALLCFFIFLAFSRIYLGASTLNQAIFGTTIGVVFAFIGHFKFKLMFLNMPEYYYSNIGGSSFKVGCKSYLAALFFCLLIPFGLAFGVFFLKYNVGQLDEKHHQDAFWRKNMLLSSCTPEQLDLRNILQHHHMLLSSIMALSFGAFIG